MSNLPDNYLRLFILLMKRSMCERWITTVRYVNCTAAAKHILLATYPDPAHNRVKKDIPQRGTYIWEAQFIDLEFAQNAE